MNPLPQLDSRELRPPFPIDQKLHIDALDFGVLGDTNKDGMIRFYWIVADLLLVILLWPEINGPKYV